MRRLFLLFISCALCTSTFGSSAASQNLDPSSKIPFFNQMAQKAEKQGRIRVIVKLAVPDIESYKAASARFKTGRSDAAAMAQAKSADKVLSSRIASAADALLNRTGSKGIQERHRYQAFPLLALDVTPDALNTLARDPQVLQITENRLFKPTLDTTVDITGASDSWNLGDGYTGADWYIAILDTGIRSTHDFFNGKEIIEACFSVEGHCPNGTDEQFGDGTAAHHANTYTGWDHGTHVAGIAAGNNADKPLYGVAKDADIIAIQIFSHFDDFYLCDPACAGDVSCETDKDCVLANTTDIIAGLDHILSLRHDHDIAAVNLSLGVGSYVAACDTGEGYSEVKLAIDELRDFGIATVVAAGNEGYCGSIAAPACISSAIAVGASTDNDVMASFSNYNEDLLNLFAPGHNIISSIADSDTSYSDDDNYDTEATNDDPWSGTSMAAPHVTGAFALLRQADDTLSVDFLLEALIGSGAEVSGNANCNDGSTLPVPRIQIDEAINSLSQAPNTPEGLDATASDWDQIDLSWTDTNYEQGYIIERKTGAGGSYSQIADVALNTTSYNDNAPLEEGTEYHYRIRAYNNVGDSEYSTEISAVTLLKAPSALAATATSKTQIDLTWLDNSTIETGFEIDRRTNSGSFSQIATLGANADNFSDTSLNAGTRYYYRIRSTNSSSASSYAQTNARTTGGDDGGGSSGGGCFITTSNHPFP